MEKVVLTNMCMIENIKTNEVLCINRCKDWPGVTFPGGHVEENEPIVTSVKREIEEETGLIISNLKLVGIRDWYLKEVHERGVVFVFKTSTYEGKLKEETEEGKIFWCKKGDLIKMPLAPGFIEELDIFDDDKTYTEVYSDNFTGNDYQKL